MSFAEIVRSGNHHPRGDRREDSWKPVRAIWPADATSLCPADKVIVSGAIQVESKTHPVPEFNGQGVGVKGIFYEDGRIWEAATGLNENAARHSIRLTSSSDSPIIKMPRVLRMAGAI